MRARKGGGSAGPSIGAGDVLRMNIASLERARDAGDDDTARRCLDALETLTRDLRTQHGGATVDDAEAPPTGRLAIAPPLPPPPETPAEILARIRDILPAAAPFVDYDEIEARCDAAIARHLPLRPPPPSDFRLFVSLTLKWWGCLGRLVWSVFKSEKVIGGR